jgi:lipid A 3-O-deacylase
MKTTTNVLRAWIAGVGLLAALPAAHSFDLHPDGVSLTAGAGESGSTMAGVGVIWDWNFWRLRPKTELTAHTELMLNGWRADAVGGGSKTYAQAVLLPTLRMRFGQGGSPWFIEVGVGASYMNHKLATPDKEFGSQWNFYDVLGTGYTFGGARGNHEVGLRLVHISNAGIKNPNPGQDFLQLRYVHWF